MVVKMENPNWSMVELEGPSKEDLLILDPNKRGCIRDGLGRVKLEPNPTRFLQLGHFFESKPNPINDQVNSTFAQYIKI